jgi:hypothetical protein
MKRLTLLVISLSFTIPALAQRAHITLKGDDVSGMAYVQGYESDKMCEFVFKDSCSLEHGRGELYFDMGEDTFVNLLIITDTRRYLQQVVIGPGDTLALHLGDRIETREDRRRLREQYAKHNNMKDSILRRYNALNDRLYSERSRSKWYRQLQDSIAAVERFYYNEFPYLILADTAMTQSAYIVHSAIAIRSLARATPRELDSLRTTYAERLPHAKCFTAVGEKITERSKRDSQRFQQLLNSK